jgi:hypothetical protein
LGARRTHGQDVARSAFGRRTLSAGMLVIITGDFSLLPAFGDSHARISSLAPWIGYSFVDLFGADLARSSVLGSFTVRWFIKTTLCGTESRNICVGGNA